MQTTSADYKLAIASTSREIRGYIDFNHADMSDPNDGFKLSGSDGLISFKTTQNAMEGERYCVGSVTSNFCEATFFNDGLAGSGVSLANSYFDAYVGVVLPDTTVEYVCCGRYYISEITRSAATTRILGYDIAGRLSVDYVPTVTPDPDDGYLVMDILNDIISQTGVNKSQPFTTFGDSTYVPEIYEGNCRAQWGWLSYLVSVDATSYSGNREPADLGYIKEYTLGNNTNHYAIGEATTYMDGLSIGDEFTITSFTTGTTDNPIVSGNGTGLYGLNPYMTQAIADNIENTYDDVSYYPLTLRWRGDPALDVMDEISVTQGVNTYSSIVMKVETTFNGGLEQTITCWGDSEEYYALSTSPTQGQINRVSNLIGEIQQAIETADGGVITKILDVDGTWKELVIANNQDLDSATSVWRFNINGLAHSNQYQGGTYTLAMDTQGRIVANVIQTGILQDALGKNSWNLDTGALTITDGSISITTSNTSLDIIQFNGDDRNNQGLGYVYNTKMQPKVFESEGHWYTPASHRYYITKVGSSDSNFIAEGGYYSNEQPTEIYFSTKTYHDSRGLETYVAQGIGATEVQRMEVDYGNGITFWDASGTQTASYPADASTLLTDNSLRLANLSDAFGEGISTSGTTKTYTLSSGTWLVSTARYNNSSTAQDGLWLVSVFPTGTSHLSAILAPTGNTTVSISGGTLTVTTGSNNVRVSGVRLT